MGKCSGKLCFSLKKKGTQAWEYTPRYLKLEGRKGRCTLHLLGIHDLVLQCHFWEVTEDPGLVLPSGKGQGIPLPPVPPVTPMEMLRGSRVVPVSKSRCSHPWQFLATWEHGWAQKRHHQFAMVEFLSSWGSQLSLCLGAALPLKLVFSQVQEMDIKSQP